MQKVFPHAAAIQTLGAEQDPRNIFSEIYRRKLWGGRLSKGPYSGSGSRDPSVVNPYIEAVSDCLRGLGSPSVVDVGCGGGILAESMAREGATVTGLDMGAEPLQVARLHALESGIQVDYVQETVEEHAAKHPQQYDVVTCMEMLEHVPDPQSVVHACARLVKPGGQVFFSTINRNGKAWLMAVVGAEYVMKMVPKGTHDVKKFIKPAELLGWVDQTTLKEQHIIGLHYNPLTNTFKLAPGVDVNYMLHTTAKQD